MIKKKKIQICPKCNQEYSDYPALSRRDNETMICPKCGQLEAMEQFISPQTSHKYTSKCKGRHSCTACKSGNLHEKMYPCYECMKGVRCFWKRIPKKKEVSTNA